MSDLVLNGIRLLAPAILRNTPRHRGGPFCLVSSGIGRKALIFSYLLPHLRLSWGTSTMVTRAVVVFQMVDLLTRFPCSVLISLQLVFSLSSSSDIVLGQRIRLREKNQSALTCSTR